MSQKVGDVIWKYPLAIRDYQMIHVPQPAIFVAAINQRGIPTLYFLVNPGAGTKELTIWIVGTGHPMGSLVGWRFLGTVNCEPFIWHIFIKKGVEVRPLPSPL